MNENNNLDLGRAIAVGLDVLNDPQTRISSNLVDDVSVFKGLLKSLQRGQLVLATPDRILPEGMNLSDLEKKEDPKDKE